MNLKVLINQLLHDQIIANLVSSSLSLTLHHQHQLRFYFLNNNIQFSSVQSLSHVRLFATPWTTARQTFVYITNSWSLLKLMSI